MGNDGFNPPQLRKLGPTVNTTFDVGSCFGTSKYPKRLSREQTSSTRPSPLTSARWGDSLSTRGLARWRFQGPGWSRGFWYHTS